MLTFEEQKKRALDTLEKALSVATEYQIGRLEGIGEQIARCHEEQKLKEKHNLEKQTA